MKKYLGVIGVFLGALTLSGCTTPEVKNEPAIKDNLTFYPDTSTTMSPGNSTPASAKTPSPQEAPVVQPSKPVSNKKMYQAPPTMSIDATKQYTATLKTTQGTIVIGLNAKETPITVNNFVFLARDKFYDGTIFHRTIPGFMIQGGDPQGTGMGGPGYQFDNESFAGKYTRGTVAMANAGINTNGSQFFIMHKDYALPSDYVIFGQVLSGMDVVDKIAEAPTQRGGEGSKPLTPVVVSTVSITEK